MNNILIIGTPRCGKTSVCNKIMEKHREYEIVRGDVLATLYTMRKKKIVKEENGTATIMLPDISNQEMASLLFDYAKELNTDLQPINKKILLDSHNIDVRDAVEMFKSKFDIYCLGMADITPEELMLKIRENDNPNDWTRMAGRFMLRDVCEYIVEQSKENRKICEQCNIDYIEMSGDRQKRILDVIEKIERMSMQSD